MIYKEEKGNLFELDSKYALAHCISLDCEMGKGIAVEFDKRFRGMKRWLKEMVVANDWNFPKTVPAIDKNKRVIFNLITKKNYWGKPTYATIGKCIIEMADYCLRHEIKYLAMPKIGCGLDRLQWSKVREMIVQKFEDLDIEIVVRSL